MITGKPDFIDENRDQTGNSSPSPSPPLELLGFCSNDRNEKLAYIYFTDRWSDEIARRDPLRDRYVILFFSAEGKFTRMFSNISEIPPIFPNTQAMRERVMWGSPAKSAR